MKIILLLLLINLIFEFPASYAQSSKQYNNKDGAWDLDISFGYGANHGGLGGKATLSDIFTIGIGSFEGQTLYEVGLQIPYRLSDINEFDRMFSTAYLNASYGGIAVQTETYNDYIDRSTTEETKVVDGWNILGGYLWVFGDEGKIFLDMATGYAFGKTKFFTGTEFEQEYEFSTLTFDIGLGYRFF